MQKFWMVLILLLIPVSLVAQQSTPAGGSWDGVMTARKGISIRVKTTHGKVRCTLLGADAESLTCRHGAPVTLQRTDIQSIKVSHRGRSTLIGAGAGAAIGFAIGFAAGTNDSNGFFGPNFLRGAIAGIVAVLGAVIGAPVGYFTDFSSGGPLYKAP